MKKKTRVFLKDLTHVSSLGFSIPLSLAISLFIGVYLDKSVFGTSPWFTLIFMFLGIAAGYRNMALAFKMARKMHDKY